jgi:zona occludens toxin
MPINGFGGGPGSGKTYGVMEHVIIPAVAKGRFIITNIDGLDTEKIYEYVTKNFYKGKILCIGHIRHCDRSAPEKDEFFPGEEAHDKAMPVPSPESPLVVGGDLVVIDEATRHWEVGSKILPRHAYFFREHRHFANEMGHTCDLVVIDPDLSMLHRALKGKIELSSITRKVKELGLERYVVAIYRKAKLTGKPQSVNGPYPFRKEVYSLYRSYAVAGAKEQMVDARQSQRKAILMRLGGMVFLLVAAVWLVIYLAQSKVDKLKKTSEAEHAAAAASSPPGTAAAPGGPASPGAPVGLPAGRSGVSDTLRVSGEVVVRGERWVVLSDGSFLRLEHPGAFVGRGVMVVGNVEGQRVSTWSGPRAGEGGK